MFDSNFGFGNESVFCRIDPDEDTGFIVDNYFLELMSPASDPFLLLDGQFMVLL